MHFINKELSESYITPCTTVPGTRVERKMDQLKDLISMASLGIFGREMLINCTRFTEEP